MGMRCGACMELLRIGGPGKSGSLGTRPPHGARRRFRPTEFFALRLGARTAGLSADASRSPFAPPPRLRRGLAWVPSRRATLLDAPLARRPPPLYSLRPSKPARRAPNAAVAQW